MNTTSNLHLPRLTSDAEQGWYHPYSPYRMEHVSRSTAMRSMRLGFGTAYDNGEPRPVRVYQAHAPQPCAACGREMASGELFTRRVVAGSPDRQRSHPHCRTCAPFDPPPHGGRPE